MSGDGWVDTQRADKARSRRSVSVHPWRRTIKMTTSGCSDQPALRRTVRDVVLSSTPYTWLGRRALRSITAGAARTGGKRQAYQVCQTLASILLPSVVPAPSHPCHGRYVFAVCQFSALPWRRQQASFLHVACSCCGITKHVRRMYCVARSSDHVFMRVTACPGNIPTSITGGVDTPWCGLSASSSHEVCTES